MLNVCTGVLNIELTEAEIREICIAGEKYEGMPTELTCLGLGEMGGEGRVGGVWLRKFHAVKYL